MGRIYDATWGKAFAAFYDRALKATEEGGLREMRAEVLAGARGEVIELGAGTGANLGLYPEVIAGLTLVEPDPDMAKRLREKASTAAPEARIVSAPGERLPFEDDSFDTAVVTLVLCTVPDAPASIAELARIVKPGGKLLFVEHVRAEEPGLALWQDRLMRPWKFFADGCRCNRPTLATLEASAFSVEAVESAALPKAIPIIRPLIHGSATLAGS